MIKQIVCGGRPDGFKEYSDCTVAALANATGIGYATSYILFEQAGREPRQATSMVSGLNEWVKEGFGSYKSLRATHVIWSKPTIAHFVRTNPRGRFVLRIINPGTRIGHVFALVDGVIINNEDEVISLRKRVYGGWELSPA